MEAEKPTSRETLTFWGQCILFGVFAGLVFTGLQVIISGLRTLLSGGIAL